MIRTDAHTISLPQLMSDRSRGEGGREQEDRPPPLTGRAMRRVAIVEDELMVAWLIESMLEDLGHEVVGLFATGEDAVQALKGTDVDLVCMDINLGRGIDGIEAARQIREGQPTAILFISAYSDEFTRMRIEEVTPDAALIGKPPCAAALEKAIENFGRPPH